MKDISNSKELLDKFFPSLPPPSPHPRETVTLEATPEEEKTLAPLKLIVTIGKKGVSKGSSTPTEDALREKLKESESQRKLLSSSNTKLESKLKTTETKLQTAIGSKEEVTSLKRKVENELVELKREIKKTRSEVPISRSSSTSSASALSASTSLSASASSESTSLSALAPSASGSLSALAPSASGSSSAPAPPSSYLAVSLDDLKSLTDHHTQQLERFSAIHLSTVKATSSVSNSAIESQHSGLGFYDRRYSGDRRSSGDRWHDHSRSRSPDHDRYGRLHHSDYDPQYYYDRHDDGERSYHRDYDQRHQSSRWPPYGHGDRRHDSSRGRRW